MVSVRMGKGIKVICGILGRGIWEVLRIIGPNKGLRISSSDD